MIVYIMTVVLTAVLCCFRRDPVRGPAFRVQKKRERHRGGQQRSGSSASSSSEGLHLTKKKTQGNGNIASWNLAGLKNQRCIRKPRTFADGSAMNHHLLAIKVPKIKRARIEAQMLSFSAHRKAGIREPGTLGRRLARMATLQKQTGAEPTTCVDRTRRSLWDPRTASKCALSVWRALSHKDWCKKISNEASEWRSFRKCVGENVRPSFPTPQVLRSPAHSPQPPARIQLRPGAGTGSQCEVGQHSADWQPRVLGQLSINTPATNKSAQELGQPRHARALLARPTLSPGSTRSSASLAGPRW